MAEHDDARPVLLLARAGEARERLERALQQAGAQVLRAVDPADADPDELRALQPGAVLVVLEPAVEDALERHDALLTDPGVRVIFDEAEVAAGREGWDAARWVRHLAAKLHGHDDVLPPGAESSDAVHPAPGPLPDRDFDPESVDVGALAEAAHDLAADVPRAFGGEEPDEAGTGAGTGDADAGDSARADGTDSSGPDHVSDATTVSDDTTADAGSGVPAEGFDGLVSAEDMDWSSPEQTWDGALAGDPAFAELLAAAEAAGSDVGGDGMAGGAGVGAPDEAASIAPNAWTLNDDGDFVPEESADKPEAGPDPLSLGDGLSLADDDLPVAPSAPRPEAIDLDAMAARLDGLSLADPDSYGHGVLRGAVVVEAGLGGPDAVRQLLGGLGEAFARAVLVRLQLDGGRYDRLVQQMQRATPLRVELASNGAMAEAGTVYFVPPGLTVAEDRARLVFAAGEDFDGIYAALPPADSALVFLSGADPERVDRAMDLAGAGALVLAQAPDTCYDATAVGALVGRGAVAAEPENLAQALLDHWP